MSKDKIFRCLHFQVSTYGVGGRMTPHYDTYRQPGEKRGSGDDGEEEDWATSIIGYITNVQVGWFIQEILDRQI